MIKDVVVHNGFTGIATETFVCIVSDTESDILARRANASNVPILPVHLELCEALVL